MRYPTFNSDKSPGISVIIPSWNEAAWLPTLLHRLERVGGIAEIIVADNASTDSTVDIARGAQCAVVEGGLPAAGRNVGAQAAKEGLLLFADADVVITSEIMLSIKKEFTNPNRTLVHFRLVPITGGLFIRACYLIADYYAYISGRFFYHQGTAPLICVRRDTFIAAGGFDERIQVAEDIEFIRRVDRLMGGVMYVRYTPLYVSARRFSLENQLIYALKSAMWGLLRLLGTRASILGYNWRRYPSHLADRDVVEAARKVV